MPIVFLFTTQAIFFSYRYPYTTKIYAVRDYIFAEKNRSNLSLYKLSCYLCKNIFTMKHLFYNKEQYYEVFDPYGGDKIFIVDSTRSKYEEDPRGMYKLKGKLKKMYMSFVYGF